MSTDAGPLTHPREARGEGAYELVRAGYMHGGGAWYDDEYVNPVYRFVPVQKAGNPARFEAPEKRDVKIELTRAEKRWNWHTWNLLLQIREATDGNDPRQRGGEMTERNLCVASGRPEMKAFRTRGWVECVAFGEVHEGDTIRELPAWAITTAGRLALDEAVKSGITVQ